MLDDLERGVDSSGTKLDDAMRRMRKFIRQTEGKFYPLVFTKLSAAISHRSDRMFCAVHIRDEIRMVHRDPDYHPYGAPPCCYSGVTHTLAPLYFHYLVEFGMDCL